MMNSADNPTQNRTGKPTLDHAETIILMAAANRKDGIALPILDSITAPADHVARKIKRLTKLSLLRELPAKLKTACGERAPMIGILTPKITPLAFEVLGLDRPDDMNPAGNEQAAETGAETVSASSRASK